MLHIGVIAAVVICWLAAVVLFVYSLLVTIRVLWKLQQRCFAEVSNNNRQCCNITRLMPWSIVVTHCAGLSCGMLAYMVLHIICDFGFIQRNSWLLSNSVFIPSYVIIIVLIVLNLSAMVYCAYKSCKS